MIREEEVYKIGRIGKPHGVRGEVTMQFTDDVFDRVDAEYLILSINGILVPFFMEEYRFRSDTLVNVKFCDIVTKEQASELTGCEVFFPRQLAAADDEQLSWSQLCGFTIIDAATQKAVGKVVAVDDSTINLLFSVVTPDGRELLLPATEELMTDVNPERLSITMRIPDGLLDL